MVVWCGGGGGGSGMYRMCAVFIKFCLPDFFLSIGFIYLVIFSFISLFSYSQVCAPVQA